VNPVERIHLFSKVAIVHVDHEPYIANMTVWNTFALSQGHGDTWGWDEPCPWTIGVLPVNSTQYQFDDIFRGDSPSPAVQPHYMLIRLQEFLEPISEIDFEEFSKYLAIMRGGFCSAYGR
jgi:hypothetical protein